MVKAENTHRQSRPGPLMAMAMSFGFFTEARSHTYSCTTIDYPEARRTWAEDINNAGLIAGNFQDRWQRNHGFLYDGETYTPLDYPDEPYTYTWA